MLKMSNLLLSILLPSTVTELTNALVFTLPLPCGYNHTMMQTHTKRLLPDVSILFLVYYLEY